MLVFADHLGSAISAVVAIVGLVITIVDIRARRKAEKAQAQADARDKPDEQETSRIYVSPRGAGPSPWRTRSRLGISLLVIALAVVGALEVIRFLWHH